MNSYNTVMSGRRTPDLSGQRFTRLVAVERDYERSRRFSSAYWTCRCDCGNLAYASAVSLLNGGHKSCGCRRNEIIVASRHVVQIKFIPESINGHDILLAEVPVPGKKHRRIFVRCGGCGYERWVSASEFILKGGQFCRTCMQRTRSRAARFTSGSTVGNFTVLAALKPMNGGFLYRVRDTRCGHEREARDNPAHPFQGRYALCGCPVRIPANGYVNWQWTMPDGKQVSVREHRIIMEQMIGRELYADENVHHRNGVTDDNQPANLELWTTSQPAGQRVEDKIAWAVELLSRYENSPLIRDPRIVRNLLGGIEL
jgi:hypothetical protein